MLKKVSKPILTKNLPLEKDTTSFLEGELIEEEVGISKKVNWNKCIDFMPMDREIEITPHILDTIRRCALDGASDEEICLFCNFSKKKWDKYLREHDDFKDWVDRLKNRITFIARKNINTAIEQGSLELSRWKIEQKNKNELKQLLEQKNSENDELSADDEQMLESFVTRTITYKQTTTHKIPLKQAKEPQIINPIQESIN